MKKFYMRVLSLLIVLCLLLPCSGISTIAVQYNDSSPPNTSETSVDIINDVSMDELTLPSYIDADSEQAQKHLFRLEELEEANTYVFQNIDGTRTVYVMDENVKYVDVDGNVREKDLSLINVIGGYETAANDIGVFMPDLPTSGIELEYSDYLVKLIPQTTAPTVGRKVTDAVDYEGAFGENTILRYTPLLSGIKEDIILESYVSNAEFSFELVTGGLRLQNNGGRYFLSNPQKDELVFWLDDIVVYDAVGRPASGQMSVETLTENERYLLTVSVDDDYLSDPTIIYPVTIDPTITVSDSTASDSIEDSPIYEGYPSRNFGTYLYNPVGKFSDEYGVGRTVVRLTGLIGLDEYQSLTAAQIESVYFYITDATGSGSHTIDLYALTNTAWTESGVTWNNYGGYSSTKYASATLGGGSETHFDITELVKAWKSGSRSAEAGFLLKNSDETLKRVYCSSEYSTVSKKPRVVLTYTGAVDVSVSTTYMLVGQTKQVSCSTNPIGLNISWSSDDTSIATVNNSGLVTGVSQGMVKITATYTDGDTGATNSDYVYLYVKDSIGIKDNTAYYVMNYISKRYLSLEHASDADFTNVNTRERSTSSLSQWKTEKQSNGTFQLVSVYSSTGKVLDFSGSNSVSIYTDLGLDYQKFAVYRINSGTYSGLYYIRHGNYYVAQDSDYNVYMTLSPSGNAVWSFMAVDTGYAGLFCHNYTYTNNGVTETFDTSGNEALFKSSFNALGYSSNSYINPSPRTAYTFLKQNDVFVFIGHGGRGMISFRDEGDVSTGVIAVNRLVAYRYIVGTDHNYVESLDHNELADERCVIYLGCNTGKDITLSGVTYNLVDATFEKGAHFVLGATEKITDIQADNWLRYFLNAISEGNSISQAINDADTLLGWITVSYKQDNGAEGEKTVYGLPAYYLGDTIEYLDVN